MENIIDIINNNPEAKKAKENLDKFINEFIAKNGGEGKFTDAELMQLLKNDPGFQKVYDESNRVMEKLYIENGLLKK